MLTQITAVFEDWHLPDGNYPAFKVGDRYRFSFEFAVDRAETVAAATAHSLTQIREAEYDVVGQIVRQYAEPDSLPFAVVAVADFSFYTTDPAITSLPVGTSVHIQGQFALDHYLWVEYRRTYTDSPELLVAAELVGIRRVKIPEQFIVRDSRSLSMPTSIRSADFEQAPEPIQAIDKSSNFGFSLLDLRLLAGTSEILPLAFIEAV